MRLQHLNAFVQEHITGMSVVQAFAVEDKEFDKFKKINKEHRNANIKFHSCLLNFFSGSRNCAGIFNRAFGLVGSQ